MKATGWLLDVYISEGAVLWFKLENGETIRLLDEYVPDFYVEPNEKALIEELRNILLSHPHILDVAEEWKFTSLGRREKTRVLHISVDSVRNFKRVIEDVGKLGYVKAYYNLDILHVQRYLYQKGFAPTSKVIIEYSDDGKLLSVQVLDDSKEIEPPPFTTLIFGLEINSETLTPKVEINPISRIVIFNEGLEMIKSFEGTEEKILSAFSNYVKEGDPDFLISDRIGEALKYILERAKALGLNINLGREKVDLSEIKRLTPSFHKGKVPLELHSFLETGIAGVVERSRFTLAPPGLASKWPAGRTIDSRQCFEALKRDVLLPKSKGFYRYVTTAEEIIFRDRGGLILSPKIGLHENVGELDFESMFPNIIIRNNLSYETTMPYKIDRSKQGFLGELTEKYLGRRLYFKHLRKRFPKESPEYVWCEQRQTTLKGILVCIYGYSGCFANRFGNVAVYEETNRVARETLVKTMNISLSGGFEVIYADSDSVFLKKGGATEQDYINLAQKISEETGLPIDLDHHYKFLVLLTQESDPNLEATRRYFGKLTNGELYFRGIELRRHDYPAFIKDFQIKLMGILFDADCTDKVEGEQLEKAKGYVIQTCEEIREGRVDLEQLIISKILRKPVKEYRSMFPHVTAAIQMIQKGKKLRTGESIDFWYVDADNPNPFRRVVPASIMNSGHKYYDVNKYVDMVLDAAETILGVFGFDRRKLGFETKPRDFLEELRLEREQELMSELRNLDPE